MRTSLEINLDSLEQSYTTGMENVSSGLRPCTSGPPDALGSRCWEGTGKQLTAGRVEVTPKSWKSHSSPSPRSLSLSLNSSHLTLSLLILLPLSSPIQNKLPLVDSSGMFLSVWWHPYKGEQIISILGCPMILPLLSICGPVICQGLRPGGAKTHCWVWSWHLGLLCWS